LKAKIAVEALKAQRTVQEIASSYSVHPNQVTNWKKQLLDFSPEAFSAGRVFSDQADEQLRTELYAQIGKLKVMDRSAWRYIWVVETDSCPSHRAITARSIPCENRVT